MKNILILKFPHSSLFGGGEQHTLTLVEELRKRGFGFLLVSSCKVLLKEFRTRGWPHKKIWAPREPVSEGSLILFPFLAPFFFLKLFWILLVFRINYNIKIVYCLSLTEKVLITLPARILGIKVVWVEHVIPERWLMLNPLKVFYRFYSRFTKIIVVSQAIKERLTKNLKINQNRIIVIPNGIAIPPVSSSDYSQRTKHKGDFVIGVVARLEKEKGIEYLLKAITILNEVIPRVKLVIVGDGSEKKNLQWAANSLKISHQVQLVGFQHNIYHWIRNFDVLVLPSIKKESFGIVLIEAMANLRPVIATSMGGVLEIIEDKKTGLLVKPKDSESLAQAVIYLYNNPEQAMTMIQNARKKVEQDFSKEKMISSFEKLFITLIR